MGGILRYFPIGNFLIASGDMVLGVVRAVLASFALMRVFYSLPRMPHYLTLLRSLQLLLLDQLAVGMGYEKPPRYRL